MNRLAIFVEGETEQLFVEWLVREIATSAHLHVEMRAARGGKSTRRRTRIVESSGDNPEIQHYFLIVDCSGDGGVKSRILEEYQNLVKYGYGAIVGLQDAPKRRLDIPKLQNGLLASVPIVPIPVQFVMAIMEIEAWFLAEYTHFSKIDKGLTAAAIQSALAFNPSSEDMRLRDHPADDLNACYQIVGERYQKGRAAQRTIYLLDPIRVVFELAKNDPEIQRLVGAIEANLGTCTPSPPP